MPYYDLFEESKFRVLKPGGSSKLRVSFVVHVMPKLSSDLERLGRSERNSQKFDGFLRLAAPTVTKPLVPGGTLRTYIR
jgi:hypothetical protein